MTAADAKSFEAIADGLGHLLADTHALYLMSRCLHWNWPGHDDAVALADQSAELAAASDAIAGRIRDLGALVPGSLAEINELTTVSDPGAGHGASATIRGLVAGHESARRSAQALRSLALEARDRESADLLHARIGAHERFAAALKTASQS